MTTITSRAHEADRPLAGQERIPSFQGAKGAFDVRFARTEGDLHAVRRLRFEVFNLELGEGFESSYGTGLDVDRFDLQCQHLVVTHRPTGAVIGTYRLQCPEAARTGEGFYSASEFDLSTLPEDVVDDSIELGRACIARSHRDKNVLFLLWCGLAAYIVHHRKSRFFGCSSLTSQDMAEGLRFYDQLRAAGRVHPDLRVFPRPELACVAPSISGPVVPTPTLFGTYLRHGAYVLGPPAIDREFGTIDFLTYIEVSEKHLRLFGPEA